MEPRLIRTDGRATNILSRNGLRFGVCEIISLGMARLKVSNSCGPLAEPVAHMQRQSQWHTCKAGGTRKVLHGNGLARYDGRLEQILQVASTNGIRWTRASFGD